MPGSLIEAGDVENYDGTGGDREFRDVVFEDVVFDDTSFVTIYYGKSYYDF